VIYPEKESYPVAEKISVVSFADADQPVGGIVGAFNFTTTPIVPHILATC